MSTNQKITIECSGEKESSHPKIYITFKENENSLKCIYCGKIFIKEEIIKNNEKTEQNS